MNRICQYLSQSDNNDLALCTKSFLSKNVFGSDHVMCDHQATQSYYYEMVLNSVTGKLYCLIFFLRASFIVTAQVIV